MGVKVMKRLKIYKIEILKEYGLTLRQQMERMNIKY